MAAAAMVTMVMININFSGQLPQERDDSVAVTTTGLEEFLSETMGPVFDNNSQYGDQSSYEDREVNDFVSSNLKEIY